jgi:hypothetical protein
VAIVADLARFGTDTDCRRAAGPANFRGRRFLAHCIPRSGSPRPEAHYPEANMLWRNAACGLPETKNVSRSGDKSRQKSSSLNLRLKVQLISRCLRVRQLSRTPLTTTRTFHCRRVYYLTPAYAALCSKRSVPTTKWRSQPSRHRNPLAGANHQSLDLSSQSRAQILRG